jgi:acyl transferase domain-containing protein
MTQDASLDVAIIGIGVRAPDSRNVEEFWRGIVEGREFITFFDERRLEANHHLLGNPKFVMAAGVLGDIDQFDAEFFGLAPRDAELTDPHHRLFLECAWEAFEDAGYDISTVSRNVTVYAGHAPSPYIPGDRWQAALASPLPECERVYIPFSNHLTTRVSHVLGLTGESIELGAACATGLVALKMGCRSLLCGDAELSLVGSASVFIPEWRGYLFQEDAFRCSPDGHCRAFDRRAHGMVHTSAVGVLLLKRLSDAIRDRDHIYAVVKSTAVNNDGASRSTYVTPGLELQAECIAEAQLMADVPPDTITYVEAHGIAVPMADAIEVEAMRRAFETGTTKSRYCALGSVKANMGHSVAAAGMMGLIKTALSLKHAVIAPQINFEDPHPDLDLTNSPFVIPRDATVWNPECGVRRAGVHSFGIGGTNAHSILEAPPTTSSAEYDPSRLRTIVLSARGPRALDTLRRRLWSHLVSHSGECLGDVAFTLATGRKAQPYRWAVVVGSREELQEALRRGDETGNAVAGRVRTQLHHPEAESPHLVSGPDGSFRLRDASASQDRTVMKDLATKWVTGRPIDWAHLFGGEMRHRVSLPTYPFQRQRYWLDALNKTEGQRCSQPVMADAMARMTRGLKRS